MSVPITQEEYARYISQQQIQRLQEDKQPDKNGQLVRRPLLVQVVSTGGARQTYQPQPAGYQPQPAGYQPQSVAYQPLPAYAPQAYQQTDDYQQPEQPYQTPVRVQAPRPKASPKPKASNRPEKPEDEENDNDVSARLFSSLPIENTHAPHHPRDLNELFGTSPRTLRIFRAENSAVTFDNDCET